ncbi:MAG: helix-turn-helix domain-containing protein [Acidimicrobiales bacterium]
MTTPTLVPPVRLGRLLGERRAAAGRSPDELAAASHGWFTAADLAQVEAGDRLLSDAEIAAVTELYGVSVDELVPQRSVLTIDLEERQIAAGDEQRRLRGKDPEPDEVLATYLSILYALRHATPGTPLTLRHADLEVLSRALRLGPVEVEQRLGGLMADPDRVLATRAAVLRRRVLVPAAGVVVAVLAAGALVLVPRSASTDQPVPTSVASATDGADPSATPTSVAAPASTVPEVPTTAPEVPPTTEAAPPAEGPSTPPTTVGSAPTTVGRPAPPRPTPSTGPGSVGLIPPATAERPPPPTTPPTTTTPDGVVLIPPVTVTRDPVPGPVPGPGDAVPDAP